MILPMVDVQEIGFLEMYHWTSLTRLVVVQLPHFTGLSTISTLLSTSRLSTTTRGSPKQTKQTMMGFTDLSKI